MMSLLDDESSITSSDQDERSDDEDTLSSDTGNSTENEQKTEIVLNKPRPKYNLFCFSNIIFDFFIFEKKTTEKKKTNKQNNAKIIFIATILQM